MTTVVLDDEFMDEIINVSHYSNAQEAVVKILADYLQQKKAQHSILDLLAMPEVADIDFNPPRLNSLYHPTDLS
ncbi:MAG: hypothetical protein NTY50_22465 [Methylobacter sp.]|nr:hypothetical protein [Methylobacter sp.]